MAHKAVERVLPPFDNNEERDVAYVMLYTHQNDKMTSVAFNDTGGEIGRKEGDFREGTRFEADEKPSVEWVATKEDRRQKEREKKEREQDKDKVQPARKAAKEEEEPARGAWHGKK